MKKSISVKQLREFGFLIGIGFPIIIGWIIPEISGYAFRPWTLWLGIPALTIGITKPTLLRYPYKGWISIGHTLGWINSRVTLGIIFIIVLQPIALIMKLFKYNQLRKKKKKIESYRENTKDKSIDMTRIF